MHHDVSSADGDFPVMPSRLVGAERGRVERARAIAALEEFAQREREAAAEIERLYLDGAGDA